MIDIDAVGVFLGLDDAGGVGITPILPMVEAAEAAGADWRLLYGGGT